MTKSPASYHLSRYNSTTYAIQHDGPIACFGAERCLHADSECPSTPSFLGKLCPYEVELSRVLEAEFRQRWELLTITPDVDDFDDLVSEHADIYLQRGRAMTRLNRGWDKRTDDGRLRAEAYKEFQLADLYLDRLWRRELRLAATLEEGLARMRERAERLRPNLQVIELLVAGRKAANDAVHTPSQPIWDDFVDGDTRDRGEEPFRSH